MRGEDGKQKTAARVTLFTCLQYGLRLLHPIMPFVTEELYHRLPGWSADDGSICASSYPKQVDVEGWNKPVIQKQMHILQDIAKGARSTRSNLGLTSKKLPMFVATSSPEMHAFATAVQDDIKLLTKSTTVTLLDAEAK